MAPNRKKKKPTSNPARGFATTSITSKSKAIDDVVLDTAATLSVPDEGSYTAISAPDRNPLKSPGKALHELTPEQLELQLEESELQILIETHGEKSRKDVSRQLSKLQTEKRLMRVQAERLSALPWLPNELMQLIISNLEAQLGNENQHKGLESKMRPMFPDDDLSLKLWALKRLLADLGFMKERAQEAILHLLQNEQLLRRANQSAIRDSLWGLDECLEWLALVCEPKELPDYESNRIEVKEKPLRRLQRSDFSTPTSTPNDSPPLSGSTTPNDSINLAPDLSPARQRETDMDCNSSVESESSSDLEPHELMNKYLSLQGQLHRVRPDLTQTDLRRMKKVKQRGKSVAKAVPDNDPKVSRLLKKIHRIENDILFDKDDATEKWIEARIDIAKENAERKRLHLDPNISVPADDALPKSPRISGAADDEDSAPMLGEFFSNLPDNIVDEETGASRLVSAEGTIEIRNFGKWTGVNPRRTLEEACKARDSSSKVSFRLISTSAFSNRHSVTITWSRDQELPTSIPDISIVCEADHRTVRIAMISISSPEAVQSEAYVSTIALFLVFANSPKEEKAHLRLPPVWRDLWAELVEARKELVDAADRDELREIRKMVEDLRKPNEDDGLPLANGHETKGPAKESDETVNGRMLKVETSKIENLPALWSSKVSTPAYSNMLKFRMILPIWAFKDELLQAIEENQVIIICGETGCGKSTQVPAFILENELSKGRYCKIYCTQPRRISAISLARRVSEELGERKNDVGTSGSVVGFAIRLESQITALTKLVYATTGIVMRMLERSGDLGDITHLILDEVHERTIDSDFLLIVLRKLMKRRPTLKVILMSATVNAEQFSKYLDGAPVMNVPGRTFPVETKYLEDAVEATNYKGVGVRSRVDEDDEDGDLDRSTESVALDDLRDYSARTRNTLAQFDEYRIEYELITQLLETIANSKLYADYSKAILVFLPGIAEIRRLNDMLVGHRAFSHGWYIYPLHSTIATDEQEQAFLVPPQGTRKIVLATNIAETGITIPDVTCVIDTGKHKEMRFDERRQLSRLIESFISRANAKQRRGRAGRVQNGLCFHLFTRARHDKMMAEQQTPEMLRLSLQDLVLRVKICKLGGIEQTLAEALDPPLPKNVQRAIDSLVDVKALTAAEDLTPLGRQLAKLPLDVFLGKLILLGSIFQCLDATLTIAAIVSSKSPFSAPMGARAQADLSRLAFKKGDSDLLTVYNAYSAWRRVCKATGSSEYQFCRKNFLSPQTLSNIEDVKAQLTTSLVEAGFLVLDVEGRAALNRARFYSRQRHFVAIPDLYDTNNSNELVVNSVIAWGFYPKLVVRDGKGWRNVANNQAVSLHPTSVNKGPNSKARYLSFYHIMQSSNKFYNAHETSAAEDFAIALVCGEADFKMYSGVIVIDGNRLRFSVSSWKVMLVMKTLRARLREIMYQSFRNPGRHLNAQQQVWLDIWQRIFSQELKT